MTLVATGVERAHRPFPVLLTIVLLLVLGIGALGGGATMLFGIGGESILPDEYLEALPLVTSWVVPGLILVIGFGLGSLITAYGVSRRPAWPWVGGVEQLTGHHWSWIATVVIGVGQMIWITIELFSIPFSALMPTFGLVGLALAVLPLTRQVRRHLIRG